MDCAGANIECIDVNNQITLIWINNAWVKFSIRTSSIHGKWQVERIMNRLRQYSQNERKLLLSRINRLNTNERWQRNFCFFLTRFVTLQIVCEKPMISRLLKVETSIKVNSSFEVNYVKHLIWRDGGLYQMMDT